MWFLNLKRCRNPRWILEKVQKNSAEMEYLGKDPLREVSCGAGKEKRLVEAAASWATSQMRVSRQTATLGSSVGSGVSMVLHVG